MDEANRILKVHSIRFLMGDVGDVFRCKGRCPEDVRIGRILTIRGNERTVSKGDGILRKTKDFDRHSRTKDGIGLLFRQRN